MLFHLDFRLAEFREREARLRAEAERHRRLFLPHRRLRLRMGELLMRLGRFVGGEEAAAAPLGAPAANLRLG